MSKARRDKKMSWRRHHNKSRANERTAEVAALRLPFGLPSGREHFVVARAMPSAAEIIQIVPSYCFTIA